MRQHAYIIGNIVEDCNDNIAFKLLAHILANASEYYNVLYNIPRLSPGRTRFLGMGAPGLSRRPLCRQHGSMPQQPPSHALSMVDQVGNAIAKAENGNFAEDAARYRRLVLAAVKPLARPTEAMVDAAHEAVWFDNYWAINNRQDFVRAVRAMITAAIDGC
jgi:hypothetical protein